MTRIALLDVDMTLVDNTTSCYNEGLLEYLSSNPFDKVYLVTGRNTNEFWQHVLKMGVKPVGWRDQLLFNVIDKLKHCGIPILGASTPYDHYLSKEPGGPQLDGSQTLMFKIDKAGDAAEQFYMPFEKEIASYSDELVTQSLLIDTFARMTGGNRFVAFPGGEANEALVDSLPMYLALTDDTEKRGQIQFLLERICAENEGALQIVFFDDKNENLVTAQSVMVDHVRVSSFNNVLVDRVMGYHVPDINSAQHVSR